MTTIDQIIKDFDEKILESGHDKVCIENDCFAPLRVFLRTSLIAIRKETLGEAKICLQGPEGHDSSDCFESSCVRCDSRKGWEAGYDDCRTSTLARMGELDKKI